MSRSRTRRIAKWTGLVVCVAIIATWAMTLFWAGRYVTAHVIFGIDQGHGSIELADDGEFTSPPRGWHWSPVPFASTYWTPSFYKSGGYWQITLPFWMPLLAVAIPTLILWRRDRRYYPPGQCQRCGYDLTGNVTGVCSECEEPLSTKKT